MGCVVYYLLCVELEDCVVVQCEVGVCLYVVFLVCGGVVMGVVVDLYVEVVVDYGVQGMFVDLDLLLYFDVDFVYE